MEIEIQPRPSLPNLGMYLYYFSPYFFFVSLPNVNYILWHRY